LTRFGVKVKGFAPSAAARTFAELRGIAGPVEADLRPDPVLASAASALILVSPTGS